MRGISECLEKVRYFASVPTTRNCFGGGKGSWRLVLFHFLSDYGKSFAMSV